MLKKQKLRNNEYYDMQSVFDELHTKSKEGKAFHNLMELPTKPTQEKPSIKEQIAASKKQLAGDKSAPEKTATKNKNNGLGD